MEKKEIKTGDILLVSGTWWLSRMIQWVTKSTWNHTGIFVWIAGELFVVEAEKRGLQLTLWDGNKYKGGKATDRTMMLMRHADYEMDAKKVSKFMMPYVGTKGYDYPSLLFYQVIFNTSGKWIGKTGQYASKRFYCSEWVAYVYNHFTGLWPDWWQVSPEMVAKEYEEDFMFVYLT